MISVCVSGLPQGLLPLIGFLLPRLGGDVPTGLFPLTMTFLLGVVPPRYSITVSLRSVELQHLKP